MSVKYFAFVGFDNKPSGLFRRIETEDEVWYELMDETGKWVFDSAVANNLMGDSTFTNAVTKQRAEEIREELLEQFRKDRIEADTY